MQCVTDLLPADFSGGIVTDNSDPNPIVAARHRTDGERRVVLRALAGETNSTLTITEVQPDDAGTYTVKLSNSAGTRTSAPAVLTVTDDSDNDGLPDSWEREHFGDLAEDGDSDFDEDGQSNLGEYLSGTDPTDPASRLAFISITLAPLTGHVTLRWQSIAGKIYQLQYKTALGDPEWLDIGDEITATAPETSYEDTAVGLAQSRFYRIELVP